METSSSFTHAVPAVVTAKDAMNFRKFALAHGVVIAELFFDGVVHRAPTLKSPKKNAGAYRFDGRCGWVVNWQTSPKVQRYRLGSFHADRHEVPVPPD